MQCTECTKHSLIEVGSFLKALVCFVSIHSTPHCARHTYDTLQLCILIKFCTWHCGTVALWHCGFVGDLNVVIYSVAVLA